MDKKLGSHNEPQCDVEYVGNRWFCNDCDCVLTDDIESESDSDELID